MANENITTLEQLRQAMIDDSDQAELSGRPQKLKWDSLPTFGGAEPANTLEVWSWDETRLLVGTCADDLTIESRGEWEE